MNRYWLSWYQNTDDYRPLSYPPNKGILSWWCSGHSDKGATICALVEGKSEEDAWNNVSIDWKSNEREYRFCDEVDKDWLPSDRFPITEKWQKERIGIDYGTD